MAVRMFRGSFELQPRRVTPEPNCGAIAKSPDRDEFTELTAPGEIDGNDRRDKSVPHGDRCRRLSTRRLVDLDLLRLVFQRVSFDEPLLAIVTRHDAGDLSCRQSESKVPVGQIAQRSTVLYRRAESMVE